MQNGDGYSGQVPPPKRARQEDPQGPEALAARHPIIRALDVLREREERQELELGRTRAASQWGQCCRLQSQLNERAGVMTLR